MNTKFYFFILSLVILSSCGKPISNFTYNPNESQAPAKIAFQNKSEKATEYEWDFGDGTKSTDMEPEHRYTSSGNYEVKLKAVKKNKSNTSTQRVFVAAPKTCLVKIETKFGDMYAKLYDDTPLHRDNFIKLVEEGYYNDLIFHRIVSGFMVQGGDPRSRDAGPKTNLGSGGPKYRIPAEFVDTLSHVKGALAAARTGGPGNPDKESSGSQFYIVQGTPVSEESLNNLEKSKGIKYSAEQREIFKTQGGTPFLDQDYTVFGQVIEGLDVIDKIAAAKTNSKDRPLENIIMKVYVVN